MSSIRELTVDETLDALVKHGVASAQFSEDGHLNYVTFHPPQPAVLPREPETTESGAIDPVDSAAMALAGRSGRRLPIEG